MSLESYMVQGAKRNKQKSASIDTKLSNNNVDMSKVEEKQQIINVIDDEKEKKVPLDVSSSSSETFIDGKNDYNDEDDNEKEVIIETKYEINNEKKNPK